MWSAHLKVADALGYQHTNDRTKSKMDVKDAGEEHVNWIKLAHIWITVGVL
jgi:hypothetical protein